MKILFSKDSWDDFIFWFNNDKKIFKKIIALIKESRRTPFHGIGKPEPLKHELSKHWSRRIDKKHRFTYSAENDVLSIHSCRHLNPPPFFWTHKFFMLLSLKTC